MTSKWFLTNAVIMDVQQNLRIITGGPFTLFAPTNAAFAKIPKATLDKLLANVTALTGKQIIFHGISHSNVLRKRLKSNFDKRS